MKKLLGIVVLGLLLVSNAFADFWKSDSWKNIERMNRENSKQRALEDEIRKQGSEDISEYWSLTTVGPKSVREAINIPIIIGGGIKSPETAAELVKAGGSIIVTGTITEEDSSIMSEIADAVHWKRND